MRSELPDMLYTRARIALVVHARGCLRDVSHNDPKPVRFARAVGRKWLLPAIQGQHAGDATTGANRNLVGPWTAIGACV